MTLIYLNSRPLVRLLVKNDCKRVMPALPTTTASASANARIKARAYLCKQGSESALVLTQDNSDERQAKAREI
jgi:hypothetical protein